MNKHQIWFLSLHDGEYVLLERGYSSLYNTFALAWFDREILHRWPKAQRFDDKTLAGHHWCIDDLCFELR